MRICRQTDGVWTNEFVKSVHPRGENYYWLTGSYRNDEPEAQDTDHWALDHGYVAITPTQIDVTGLYFDGAIESLELAAMKYYLIVGEASGDLHASNLMKALQEKDSKAEFRFSEVI